MTYDEILKVLAPCGLNCGKCIAFADGPVREHARALAGLLGENFAAYAQRFTHFDPVFAKYPEFREFLDMLGRGSCSNCRGSGCLFQECKVTRCVREKKVDFCFQCAEFPCADHGFPPPLAQLWEKNNKLMDQYGVESYFEHVKDKPRYP